MLRLKPPTVHGKCSRAYFRRITILLDSASLCIIKLSILLAVINTCNTCNIYTKYSTVHRERLKTSRNKKAYPQLVT